MGVDVDRGIRGVVLRGVLTWLLTSMRKLTCMCRFMFEPLIPCHTAGTADTAGGRGLGEPKAPLWRVCSKGLPGGLCCGQETGHWLQQASD